MPLEEYAESLQYETPEESDLFFAVMALPKKYRAIVHLYYYEDYSTREIAEMLRTHGAHPASAGAKNFKGEIIRCLERRITENYIRLLFRSSTLPKQ